MRLERVQNVIEARKDRSHRHAVIFPLFTRWWWDKEGRQREWEKEKEREIEREEKREERTKSHGKDTLNTPRNDTRRKSPPVDVTLKRAGSHEVTLDAQGHRTSDTRTHTLKRTQTHKAISTFLPRVVTFAVIGLSHCPTASTAGRLLFDLTLVFPPLQAGKEKLERVQHREEPTRRERAREAVKE